MENIKNIIVSCSLILLYWGCSYASDKPFNIREIHYIPSEKDTTLEEKYFVIDYDSDSLPTKYQNQLDSFVLKYIRDNEINVNKHKAFTISVMRESDKIRDWDTLHGITDSKNLFTPEHYRFVFYQWYNDGKDFFKENQNRDVIPSIFDHNKGNK